MKKILTVILALIVFGAVYWYVTSDASMMNAPKDSVGENERVIGGNTGANEPQGKIKAEVFSGKLEEVNTGCFADGECYVVVGGKHVTTLMGWTQTTVGSVIGVEGFGDLEGHIGKEVEVYAHDKGDGTYTLYGSEGFYVKLLN